MHCAPARDTGPSKNPATKNEKTVLFMIHALFDEPKVTPALKGIQVHFFQAVGFFLKNYQL
jgi:hypothetical protein